MAPPNSPSRLKMVSVKSSVCGWFIYRFKFSRLYTVLLYYCLQYSFPMNSAAVADACMRICQTYLLFLLQYGTPPNPRFVFDTQSIVLWPRSENCEGCRFRSRDGCVGSLDLLVSALYRQSHHNL
jgi:hypothetical protein